MRADRSESPSRAAIDSIFVAGLETMSSSQRRPLAIAAKSFVLASARIGLMAAADTSVGWISSRLRRNVAGDQGIVVTLE